MNKKNAFGLFLTLLSLGVLIPGLIQPMLNIEVKMGAMVLFTKTQSILQTAQTLYQDDHLFPAFLVFFFSVLIPVLKSFMLLSCFIIKNEQLVSRIHKTILRLGKWSMADVFVIGTFVCYLAANSSMQLESHILPGFYFFTGYCLISLLSLEFLDFSRKSSATATTSQAHSLTRAG
jgi:uncharacterized paraquat-inducible protein A